MSRLLALLPLTLALLCAGVASAADYTLGALRIGNPWSRATPPTAPTAGAYLTITNTGATADRLVSVRSPAAPQAEVHEMKMEGNVMRMRELEHGLEIPPGATVSLAPGGFHIMLVGLKAPLKAGMRVPLTLVFEKAGAIDVELSVEAMGAMPKMH